MPSEGASAVRCSLVGPSVAQGQSISTPLGDEEGRLRAPIVGAGDSVYHKHETLVNVQFSQVQLSQWAAGGQSSASLIAKVDQFWEYDGLKFGWDTEVHGHLDCSTGPTKASCSKQTTALNWPRNWVPIRRKRVVDRSGKLSHPNGARICHRRWRP